MIGDHIEALHIFQNANPNIGLHADLLSQRVLFVALGKSGLIAQRAAASWRSVGVDAAFMHATEGLHGDGSLRRRAEVLVALSQSGETEEVIYHAIRHPLVLGITGKTTSTLADHSSWVIDTALPSGWVEPIPIVTCTLQAVALDVLLQRHIDRMTPSKFKDQIAFNHPGGAIGKRITS